MTRENSPVYIIMDFDDTRKFGPFYSRKDASFFIKKHWRCSAGHESKKGCKLSALPCHHDTWGIVKLIDPKKFKRGRDV